jgi:hypothetical protein
MGEGEGMHRAPAARLLVCTPRFFRVEYVITRLAEDA